MGGDYDKLEKDAWKVENDPLLRILYKEFIRTLKKPIFEVYGKEIKDNDGTYNAFGDFMYEVSETSNLWY
jgi:hypothetical protein